MPASWALGAAKEVRDSCGDRQLIKLLIISPTLQLLI